MRQQYKRQSFAAWAFWLALLVGGTLYGASRFDWLDFAWLHLPATGAPTVAQTTPGTESAPHPLPPDGQIQVAPNAVGAQSEPPPEIDDTPPASRASAASTKARLMVQRAEETAPQLRANSTTSSSVEPANIDDVDMRRPRFNVAAEASATPSTPQKPALLPETHKSAVVPASQTVEEPMTSEATAIDPQLATRLKAIDALLQADDVLRAHRELSTLYWSKPGWRSSILQRIEKTANAIYFDPRLHFIEPYIIKPNDQLVPIAKRYNVPWQYLAKLNRIDPKQLRPAKKLKVMQGPFSAIVESSSFLLTIHAYGYFVRAYPIGIGRDSTTPIGKFAVLNKVTQPQYTDPRGHVVDADDPQNPLGPRWLDLGNSYGIHGTIDPASIGKAESRGCIRMRNEDVLEVFDMLGVGSEVTIRP
jgi:hypothetical protein